MAIQPIQPANSQAQGASALPKQPPAAQTAAPQDQDKVTISESAKQALANSKNSASGR